MDYLSFPEAEYHHKISKTWRGELFDQMDALIPRIRLERKIARHYPKADNVPRPYQLSTKL